MPGTAVALILVILLLAFVLGFAVNHWLFLLLILLVIAIFFL